jgi:uncharacterized protein YtpQ (UPF0354 family)
MRIGRRRILSMGLLSLLGSIWKPAQARDATPFGSIGAFRQHVMALLRDRHLAANLVPDPNDPAKFTMTVNGEEVTGDVTNVFGYIQAYPDQNASDIIDHFIDHFIASVTYDTAQPIGDDQIVAVIRTANYMQLAGPDILHERLGADLMIVYMADRPDAMEPLSKARLPGKSLADVRRAALDNIRKWLPKVVSDDGLGDGTLYYVDGNTMLSTSLLLLDDFWKSVAVRFPGDVLIALPRKDQLFLFDDKPELHAGVRRLIDGTFQDNFNLLSAQLYARRNGKIEAVPD